MTQLLNAALSLSVTTWCILLLSVVQVFVKQARSDQSLGILYRAALPFLFCAVLLYSTSLAMPSLNFYQSGAPPVTLTAVVLTLAAIALWHRYYAVSVWLMLAWVCYEFSLLASDNLWDYLVDPFATAYAAAIVIWQRHRFHQLRPDDRVIQNWALMIVSVFLIYAVFLAWSDPLAFRFHFVIEDGFVEWITVVVLATTMVVCLRRVVILRHCRSRLFLSVTALLAALCLFGAGEEISWGQRIFDLETPEYFQEKNAQGEIGLHNLVVEINGEAVKLNKLIFGTGLAIAMVIYLFVATPLYRTQPPVRRFFDAIAAPMPRNYQVIGYLAVVATVELLIDHSKRGEMTEFAGSIIFALNVIYPYNAELFNPGQPAETT